MLADVGVTQVLLGQLRGGVHVARIEPVILGHGLAAERATAVGAGRLEVPGVEGRGRSRPGPHDAVIVAAVATLAVDHHRRSKHDASGEIAFVERSEEDRRAAVVARDVVLDIGEVDAEPHLCRLVAHRVDVVEHTGAFEVGSIADVSPVVGRVGMETGRQAVVGSGVEIVDDHDLVA